MLKHGSPSISLSYYNNPRPDISAARNQWFRTQLRVYSHSDADVDVAEKKPFMLLTLIKGKNQKFTSRLLTRGLSFQTTSSNFRRRYVNKFHWSNKKAILLNSTLVLEVYLLQRSLFYRLFRYYSAIHRQNGYVVQWNITFFFIFAVLVVWYT